MPVRISRRAVVGGLGALGSLSVFGPGFAQALSQASAQAGAQGSQEDGLCLTMIYGPKAKFESDRYRDKHLPLLRHLYGDSLERIEMRHAPHPGKDVPPAPIVATVNLWIRDLKTFGTITQQSGAEIVADLAKVTSDKPWVQYDQTVVALGDARGAVRLGSDCMTYFYPNGENARWDAKLYAEGYVPQLVEAYGKDTFSRIEVCKGTAAQGGGKPGFAGAMNLYVHDMQAYLRGGMAAMKLMPEAMKATDIRPVVAGLIVRAAG